MSEQETTTTIEVAAYGWQGTAWDSFYPEDIPDDWRLDYYANEFFAVVVPWEAWGQADDEALLAWQGQVSDDFRFYWELPADWGEALGRLQRLRVEAQFAAHWGGVAVCDDSAAKAPPLADGERPELLWLDEPMALRALREAIEAGMAQGGRRLLVMVRACASANLRPARDIVQLLGCG